MLSTSKVMSFIDNEEGYTLYFFEGQKLIHDLALIHDLKGEGFHFLRDSILASQLISVFLKPKENYGFYIDSENPYLRFKIETNYNGYMRTLLMPEDITEFPKKITGVYRVSKVTEGQPEPYNTIIDIKNKSLEEIMNQFFRESFQINGKVFLSDASDQSVFIMKLPDKNVDKIDSNENRMSVEEYWSKKSELVTSIFEKALNDQASIEKEFSSQGFLYLGSKEVQFKCACSRERMVSGVLSVLRASSFEDLFQGDKSLETKCDYCKTYYEITEEEMRVLLKDV